MTAESSIPLRPAPEIPAWLEKSRRPFHADMHALYSSEYGGIITEPLFMTVPIDDHLVHRGDGVFETLKCMNGNVYCFYEHLDRLFRSAEKIALKVNGSREQVGRLILDTIRISNRRDCLIRVLVSRGPGSMGINPYDCPISNLYILIHRLPPPFMTSHPGGASVITSNIPVKAGIFATIKTCNYLPNALLKKEAVDRKADFSINFDEDGFLAEGATENVGIVSREGMLVTPGPDRILSGTTMNRIMDLASEGVSAGWLAGKKTARISRNDLISAREILIFGTTTDVTAVVSLDGQPVMSGQPGPVFKQLSRLLLTEQAGNNPHCVSPFA